MLQLTLNMVRSFKCVDLRSRPNKCLLSLLPFLLRTVEELLKESRSLLSDHTAALQIISTISLQINTIVQIKALLARPRECIWQRAVECLVNCLASP